MWTDEIYGLKNVKETSLTTMIIHGMPGQASASPLDYVMIKIIDQIKTGVKNVGISELSYYRLWPNICTVLSVSIISFLLITRIAANNASFSIKIVQYLLAVTIPLKFLFSPDIYYYAMEMRPYALWNSLWFLALGSIILQVNRRIIGILLILLSLSATAVIFQFFALGVTIISLGLIENKSLKPLLYETGKLFIIPLGITAYYLVRSQTFAYSGEEWGTWGEFQTFWLGHLDNFYLIGIIGIICLYQKSLRHYAIAPLTMALLFLLGPIIFYLTRTHGFFFTPRQYIYYWLAKPLAVLTLIQLLPIVISFFNNNKSRYTVLIIILMVAMANMVSFKLIRKVHEGYVNASHIFQRDIIYATYP